MIVRNAYLYVHIGLCLRLLQHIAAPCPASIAKSTVDKLKKLLEKANFEVSIASLRSSSYSAMWNPLSALDDNENIPPPLVGAINDRFKTLEDVVFAEAVTKKIYVLPQRRYNTEYLLDDPSKLLKPGAFEKLEDIAKQDFASSCRCLLFGEPTAAAFHILRATESTLKKYYFHHRRQKRLAKPMWGPMLDQLKAKTKNKPPPSLLTALDLIRDRYRNPTQHPETTYEIDSAQDLFGVCIDVIGKMTNELS